MLSATDLHLELRGFFGFNQFTRVESRDLPTGTLPVYVNEYWTAKQRDGHSLHEVSYRACYKPQLPAFFIERFCQPGDCVYDPFMGRGTTLIEAQLRGCQALGNDISPLSRVLAGPRLDVPETKEISARLAAVPLEGEDIADDDLLVFFHRDTLREIGAWRAYFRARREAGTFDRVDAWIQMIASNRLTGHSTGFFSVYTLPPNQATSVVAQRKINAKRNQVPAYRDTKAIIEKKSQSLLRDPLPRGYDRGDAVLVSHSADDTPEIASGSVRLVVTSPPFVDTVDYAQDNWLRNWFVEVEEPGAGLWQARSLDVWIARMTATFRELGRVLAPGGVIAFEVGEVKKGAVLLENQVVEAGVAAGLTPVCIMINVQDFTKTANCWGVDNNTKGTNSNRIVIFTK